MYHPGALNATARMQFGPALLIPWQEERRREQTEPSAREYSVTLLGHRGTKSGTEDRSPDTPGGYRYFVVYLLADVEPWTHSIEVDHPCAGILADVQATTMRTPWEPVVGGLADRPSRTDDCARLSRMSQRRS